MADSDGGSDARSRIRVTSSLIPSEIPSWLEIDDAGVTVRIFAKPGASRRRIIGSDPRGLAIALTAPPEQGRANDELIDLIADTLGCPRTILKLVRGGSSRFKQLRIMTNDPGDLLQRLKALAMSSR